MGLKPDPHEWDEAVHEYGEARCEGCNELIDLSEADSINEGIEIWNEHVRAEHSEGVR